ncbi:MAG: hypothetical protein WD468_05300 [Pirellulales bacterium]
MPVACGLLLSAIGCNRMPETVSVTGQVTYRGQPLTMGDVQMVPRKIADGKLRRPATSLIDKSGRFEMSTFKQGDGMVPGEYGVAIVAIRRYPNMMDPNDKPEYAVPERYVDPSTSGLSVVVPSDASPSVELEFKLVD